jgi:serine protease
MAFRRTRTLPDESCGAAYQSVISELAARGVLVVVSAGNDGASVSSPANCAGAVAVAGIRHAGTKVGYSNLGLEVAVSAPAGNCVNVGADQPCLFSIDTTTNSGSTGPANHGYTDQNDFNVGTSFSSPLVAGVAALMRGTNGRLPPSRLASRVSESARPFPDSSDASVPVCHVPAGPFDVQGAECVCTTSTCGAGMLDADAAVRAAQRPISAPRAVGAVAAGQDVVLDGAGSVAACGRSVVSYQWSVVDGSGVIADADRASASIAAPSSGSVTVRLTVTDDRGATDGADLLISPNSAAALSTPPLAGSACLAEIAIAQEPPPSTTPPVQPNPPAGAGNGGGGGGGSVDWPLLLALSAWLGIARRRTVR